VRYRQGRLIGRMQGLGFPLREEAVLRSARYHSLSLTGRAVTTSFFDLAHEQRGRQGIAGNPPAMQDSFRVGCAHSAGAVEVLLAVIV
jgi:hypothetical protein